MLFALCIGVLSAFVILIAMWRIGIDKFMGYPAIMDVLVTVVLIWMLHGSYVGMVAAIIGGLTFSAIITVLRKTRGYSCLTLRGWKHYEGTWSKQLKEKQLCWNLKSLISHPASIAVCLVLLCVLSI